MLFSASQRRATANQNALDRLPQFPTRLLPVAMVVVSFSPSLDDAVAATADVVAELASGRSETALAHMQALARSTHGRCVLGLGTSLLGCSRSISAVYLR